MTRLTRSLAVFVPLCTLWLLAFFGCVSVPGVDTDTQHAVLMTLPFNLLLALGAFVLWDLGWGLLTLGDCKDAHAELVSEIDLARQELRAKGVDVD